MKRKNITLKKMSLHDEHHHSFVFGLSTDALLKMMTSMTAQHKDKYDVLELKKILTLLTK